MKFLTVFVTLLLCAKLFGQYQFEENVLNVDKGLPQSVVSAMKKDSKGFLWIGTNDGLCRYDGTNLKIFHQDEDDSNSIWGVSIISIFEDRKGYLWFGKNLLGISKFDRNTSSFKNYLRARTDSGDIQISTVKKFIEDRYGNIWVVCDQGILIYEKEEDEFKVDNLSKILPKKFLSESSLFANEDGNIIIFVPMHGFYEYDLLKKKLVNHITAELLKNILPLAIHQHTNNDFIIAVGSGVYSFNLLSSEFKQILKMENLITAFYPAPNKRFWIGSYDMKVELLKEIDGSFKLEQISRNFRDVSKISTVKSFEMTDDGSVWVGTNGAGISRIVRSDNKFGLLRYSENLFSSLYNMSVRSILPINSKNILIGGYSGLELYNFENKQSKLLLNYFKSSEHFIPYGLLIDRNDSSTLWIGSEGTGLIKYGLSSKRKQQFLAIKEFMSATIRTIYQLKNGDLLCGSLNGIRYFNVKSQKFENENRFTQSTHGEEVKTICQPNGDEYWVGTALSGILVLNSNGTLKTKLDLSNKSGFLNRNSVNFLLSLGRGNIWAATSAGLAQLNSDGYLINFFTTKDGLPNNNIYSVLKDNENNLWCSTNNGLSRFDLKQKSFTNFTVVDGLQSREFNMNAFATLGDSILFFGGLNGLNYFTPSSISKKKLAYPVFVHSIASADLNIQSEFFGDDDRTIELSSDDRELNIFVSSPIFQNPNETSLYFLLEGYRDKWEKLSNPNLLTLQNIPYGHYKLKLIRTTPDNLSTDLATSFYIYFTPPFYLTVWFKILVVAFFTFVGPSIYYFRTRQLMREKSISRHFSQRLITEQESERKRVAYALHDSLGQQLSLLKMKMRRLKIKEETGNEKEEMLDLLSETIDEIRRISHDLHPHLLEKIGLTKSLESLLTTFSEFAPFKFVFYLDNIDAQFTRDEAINLYRLIQEALNNALKHSSAKNINLEIKLSVKAVTILIEDDGVGIDFNNLVAGNAQMGIEGMRERANYINAEINFDSGGKKGTRILITKTIGDTWKI